MSWFKARSARAPVLGGEIPNRNAGPGRASRGASGSPRTKPGRRRFQNGPRRGTSRKNYGGTSPQVGGAHGKKGGVCATAQQSRPREAGAARRVDADEVVEAQVERELVDGRRWGSWSDMTRATPRFDERVGRVHLELARLRRADGERGRVAVPRAAKRREPRPVWLSCALRARHVGGRARAAALAVTSRTRQAVRLRDEQQLHAVGRELRRVDRARRRGRERLGQRAARGAGGSRRTSQRRATRALPASRWCGFVGWSATVLIFFSSSSRRRARCSGRRRRARARRPRTKPSLSP